MSGRGKFGKNQGKIYRFLAICFLVAVLVLAGLGYGAYRIIQPRYEAYRDRKEQEDKEKQEQERLAEEQQEQAMKAAMEGGIQWGGHTYKLYEDGMTWKEAENFCESVGGHLVIIESRDEENLVEGMLGNRNFYWLGASVDLSKKDARWLWVNGEPLEYSNWHGTQPDNFTGEENCLMMYNYTNPSDSYATKGLWNDVQEDGECQGEEFFGADNSGFICEWDTVA